MDYGQIVKAAWAADPQFVTLCKTLWGPDVTPEEVIAKDGPDASAVHVPGNSGCKCKGACKCKGRGMPTMDARAMPSMVAKASPSYNAMPHADRQIKRDDRGRFATVGEVAYNGAVAATAGIGSGLVLNHSKNDATKLGKLIAELKSTPEGRLKLLQVIGSRGTRLGVLAAGGTVLGAAAGFHGKEAYEGIKDHAELERAHLTHLNRAVTADDVNAATTGDDPHHLEVMTRGARRDARSHVWTKDADQALFSTDSVAAQKESRKLAALPSSELTAHFDAQRDAYNSDAGSHYFAQRQAVGKAAEELTGQLTQVDPDKRQVFGWASIVEKDGEPVVDLQGDYIGIDELEKSAYDYVHKSRIGGAMHRRVGPDGQLISKTDAPYHAADLIESFVVTPEKIEKMGLPASTPVGWWVGFKVNDDEVWKSVKSGDWKGFSIHGAGRRRPIGEVSDFDITGAELTR